MIMLYFTNIKPSGDKFCSIGIFYYNTTNTLRILVKAFPLSPQKYTPLYSYLQTRTFTYLNLYLRNSISRIRSKR